MHSQLTGSDEAQKKVMTYTIRRFSFADLDEDGVLDRRARRDVLCAGLEHLGDGQFPQIRNEHLGPTARHDRFDGLQGHVRDVVPRGRTVGLAAPADAEHPCELFCVGRRVQEVHHGPSQWQEVPSKRRPVSECGSQAEAEGKITYSRMAS